MPLLFFRISFFSLAISLFVTFPAWGLGFGESVPVKVLGWVPKFQTVMLNRGTSDDFLPDQHIKLYNNGVFVARAYAVEVSLFQSIWVVYQIFEDTALTDKLSLQAVRLASRFVPKKVVARAKSLDMDYIKNELSNQNTEGEPQFESTLKLGMSESKTPESDGIPITETGGVLSLNPDVVIDETTGQEEIQEKNFAGSLQASPIKFTRLNNSREIAYGVNINSQNWGKKELAARYNYSTSRSKPAQFGPGSETVVTSSNYNAGVNFDYNKFWGPLTFFMFATFDRQRDGTIYPLRYRWNMGPAGLKWDIYESEKITDLSVSYVPVMEFSQQDVPSTREVCCDSFGDPFTEEFIDQVKNQKSRHSFRMKFAATPIPNLTISNTFWYKPFHDFANKEVDLRDSLLENSFAINYQASETVGVGYQNLYTWDITRKRLLNLPSSNMDHIFTIGYNFQF
jgi:hypothetical protein